MKLKYILELEPEQVEVVVRQDLMWHLANSYLEPDERQAMEIVLQYYSIPE